MTDNANKQDMKQLWCTTMGVASLDELAVTATYAASPEHLAAQLAATIQTSATKQHGDNADTLDAQSAALVDHEDLAPLTQPVTALVTFPNAAMVAQDAQAQSAVATLASSDAAAAVMASAPPPMPQSPEASPPHYRVVREIGRGGMGVVYCAEQRSLNREVALKMVSPDLKDASRSKFQGEAIVTGCLDHPNIIPVHELIEDASGDAAFVMKLIKGRSWSEHFKEKACFEEHMSIFLSVCNAIEYAHSKGLAHLDLKPDNVMVGAFGEVLVMDWGLAVDIRETPSYVGVAMHKSQVRAPCGTPCYIAPELALGWGDQIGPWTDVYLLGAILYEILTGAPLHPGKSVEDALNHAIVGPPPVFDESVPEALRELCERAVAHAPIERYQGVAEFREELEAYLQHRESILLSENAEQLLSALGQDDKMTEGAQEERYTLLHDALAAFRQAALLWPENPAAQAGEVSTQHTFAKEALGHGDLGVARAHAAALPDDHPARGALMSEIDEALRRRTLKERTAQRIKRGLALAIIAIIAGLAIAYVAISQERQKAVMSSELAEERLQALMQLSDSDLVNALIERSEDLWPALPNQVASMRGWLQEAEALVTRLEQHKQWRDTLRAQGTNVNNGWVFAEREMQWEHNALSDMVDHMERLKTAGLSDMARRLQMAETITERSISGYEATWTHAVQAIKSSRHYGGLTLTPQLGLVPLGADPESGLWEFGHVQSGELPTRDPEGRLLTNEASAIVLVLLPGGTFTMGAEKPSEARPEGSPNIDPDARSSEGPVHEVTLDPFFIAKHELTQSQWTRLGASNPAAYLPGSDFGGKVVTLRHPVEQVRWHEARRTLGHLALVLPTEAQWEYAMRGGTRSVYSTGNNPKSLQGSLNIADRYCMAHEGPGSWRYELWLEDGYTVHAPVGSYSANGYGLHDMAGNVWEWVADRYGDYTMAVRPGDGLRMAPKDAPGVFRGGGFRATKIHARAADRYTLYAHDFRAYDVGVRAARAIEP